MNNKGIRWIGSIVLGLLLILVSLLFWNEEVVLVESEQGQFFINETTFELGWIHSVEKEPWFERYEVQNGQLLLTETYFKTFGAGTPSNKEIVHSNDGFIHMKINQIASEINMVVSHNVKVTLFTNKQTIQLYEIFDDYSNVTIKAVKVPKWKLLRGEYNV